jgi:PAT family beta-lactamase induction signal transducer AmpG
MTAALQRWVESLAIYRERPVVASLFLGFAAGLPFLLVFSTLSAWLREAGVSRSAIGHFSWVGLAYSIKFVWAPVLDHAPFPFLTSKLGRRRGWMLAAQVGIALGLLAMGSLNPARELHLVAAVAVFIAFCSATQDVTLDAWRIESTGLELQGATAAAYQLGYRVALLAAGAGALYIAQYGSWTLAYVAMAGLALVGALTTLAISEPAQTEAQREAARAARRSIPAWANEAIVKPFDDFFRRYGLLALALLAFIALFRLSDIVMGVMANPFYIDLGFTKEQIADVSKIYGFFLTIVGAFAGGSLVYRLGAPRLLALAALLTAGSNLAFMHLAAVGRPDVALLVTAIGADNFAGGLAGSVFIAFLSGLANRAYTATQYALFSSLMTLPGKFTGGFSGEMVDALQAHAATSPLWRPLLEALGASGRFDGYAVFFAITAALGLPAILLGAWLARQFPEPVAPQAASSRR